MKVHLFEHFDQIFTLFFLFQAEFVLTLLHVDESKLNESKKPINHYILEIIACYLQYFQNYMLFSAVVKFLLDWCSWEYVVNVRDSKFLIQSLESMLTVQKSRVLPQPTSASIT